MLNQNFCLFATDHPRLLQTYLWSFVRRIKDIVMGGVFVLLKEVWSNFPAKVIITTSGYVDRAEDFFVLDVAT